MTPSQLTSAGWAGSNPLAGRRSARDRGGEIGGDERDVRGDRNPRGRQGLAFPVLRRRVVDLEDLELVHQPGPVAERVKPGAEDDILPDTVGDGAGEPVFGVPAAADHLRPGRRQYGMAGVVPVVVDELVGAVAEQRRSYDVSEDERGRIDDEVRGARCRCHECGLAWPGKDCHAGEDNNQ